MFSFYIAQIFEVISSTVASWYRIYLFILNILGEYR